MFDCQLRGGFVVDGTGKAGRVANVYILAGRIAQITEADLPARETVDVSGLAVTPGFIDTHSHADTAHFKPHPVLSQVAQGVTTEIAGNCGTSIMPTQPQRQEALDAHMRTKKGMDAFASVSDFVEAGNVRGACLNFGTLIGHSTLRLAVMGFVNRDPDENEMRQLEDLLDRELAAGAFGMSLGLIYPPSAFSKPWELVRLARVVAKHDGILAVHMRNEGPRLFAAVEEMLEITRASGVHLHISHLKLMGKPQWGQHPQLLKMLDDARAEGLNVTCDQYPFTASSTSLSALVPHWAHEGGNDAMRERLLNREGDICQEIAKEMENRGGPEAVMVVNTYGRQPQWEGKRISQLSETLGLSPVETVLRVLIDCSCQASCVYFSMNKADMLGIMAQRYICVGSDGESMSHDREITKATPHPRYFAAFARFYETVREENVMQLETAVHKTTGLPASILGLRDRGLLKAGMAADIAVFDPETIGSNADFTEARVWPRGVQYVLVNGEFVIRDGAYTGSLPGKVLTK